MTSCAKYILKMLFGAFQGVHVGMILKDFSEPFISLNRTRWVGERGFQNCTSAWDYRKFQFNCNFLTDQKPDLNTSTHRDLEREAQG